MDQDTISKCYKQGFLPMKLDNEDKNPPNNRIVRTFLTQIFFRSVLTATITDNHYIFLQLQKC